MTITTLDQFIAAASQQVSYLKTASRTAVAGIHFSVFDLAGNPGAGTLAVGNTANGIVPTDAVAGYPTINSFAGLEGYLGGLQFGSSIACRMTLMDCLFSAGAYTFNANVALASQPSFSGRVPGGTDFNNTELWFEAATAFTGNPVIQVTYNDQDGNAGDTGAVNLAVAPIIGRMFQLPLAAGDTGLRQINSVVATIATVGTFNLHVMRRLWQGRVRIANDGDAHDFLKTGMPQIFDTSALRLMIAPDSTATGVPEIAMEIVSG